MRKSYVVLACLLMNNKAHTAERIGRRLMMGKRSVASCLGYLRKKELVGKTCCRKITYWQAL